MCSCCAQTRLSNNDLATQNVWTADGRNGSKDSDVPSQALSAQLIALLLPCRQEVSAIDRAEVRAGPEDVGDQTLIRGLDTAFPFVRPGLSLSKRGHRSCDRQHSPSGSSPAVAPPSLLHD